METLIIIRDLGVWSVFDIGNMFRGACFRIKDFLWHQSKIDNFDTIVEGDDVIKGERRKERIDETGTIVDKGRETIDDSMKREESENDKGENNTAVSIVTICAIEESENNEGENAVKICAIDESDNNEGENNMKVNIESNCTADCLVKIENLETDKGTILHLLNIANIQIRPYITGREARRVADYMKIVVNAVIKQHDENNDLSGKDLVKIEQASTNEGTFYVMYVAGLNLRGYIDGYEASIQKNFMIKVVDSVIGCM